MFTAFPLAVTISWNDLSSHRSVPLPWSIARFTSPISSGALSSRHNAKTAASTA